ncbi:MAG: TIGR04283 family arsenosugar biosynthesis glycosyltransferase [Ginsengibacter sp.]
MEKVEEITIIIPTLDESKNIGNLIKYLKLHALRPVQIIVSDGGSSDNTVSIAKHEGAMVVKSLKKGRASQMNFGASFSTGNILYFVHADCLPPENYFENITESVKQGSHLGRFQTKFKSRSILLKFNSFFTKFDWFICYGGDQTLFITADTFKKINGFDEKMLIMEDYDIVKRARSQFQYAILNGKVLVSARKYETNSWLKVQLANRTIVKMYKKGFSQEILAAEYKQLLNYR